MLLISGGQVGNSKELKCETDVSAVGTVCNIYQPVVLNTLTIQSLVALLCTTRFNIQKFNILPKD
jgi:hypothetical protein